VKMEVEEGPHPKKASAHQYEDPTPLMVNGEFVNEENLLFFQLPTSLPFTIDKKEEKEKAAVPLPTGPNPALGVQDFTSTIAGGPSGYLGKIIVYKSGKVKMKIGDFLYDINAANNPNFLEELMVINTTSHTCCRIGPMAQHLIVTPNVDKLLDQCSNLTETKDKDRDKHKDKKKEKYPETDYLMTEIR